MAERTYIESESTYNEAAFQAAKPAAGKIASPTRSKLVVTLLCETQ